MSVNYFIVAFFSFLTSLGFSFLLFKMHLKIKPDKKSEAIKLTALFCVIFIICYSFLSCIRFYNMIYGLWDFGVADEAIRQTAKFRGFLVGFEGGHMEHFSPIHVIWVPFYWLWDSPYVLLIGQSILLGIAGIPLYFLAQKTLGRNGWPLIIVLMYYLNPYISRFVLYEYHMGAFYPVFFFSAWIAFYKRKMFLFYVLLFASVLAKESFCLVIIACVLFLISRKTKRKVGLFCLIGVILTVFFILKVWFPHIVPLNYHHTTSRFPPVLGNNLLETCRNLLHLFSMIFSIESLAVLISLMLPFAFIPLFSWRTALSLFLPVFIVQLCSTHIHQRLLVSHYSDILLPLLPFATIVALQSIKKGLIISKNFYSFLPYGAIGFTLVSHVLFCELPIAKYNSYIPQYKFCNQIGIFSIPLNPTRLANPRAVRFHEIKNAIPKQFTVCAQNNLAPFFLRHKRVFTIRNPLSPDFYVFDLKSFDGYDPFEILQQLIEKVAKDTEYTLLLNESGFIVFCKKSVLTQLDRK